MDENNFAVVITLRCCYDQDLRTCGCGRWRQSFLLFQVLMSQRCRCVAVHHRLFFINGFQLWLFNSSVQRCIFGLLVVFNLRLAFGRFDKKSVQFGNNDACLILFRIFQRADGKKRWKSFVSLIQGRLVHSYPIVCFSLFCLFPRSIALLSLDGFLQVRCGSGLPWQLQL